MSETSALAHDTTAHPCLSGCCLPGYFRVPEGLCATDTPISSRRALGQFPNIHHPCIEQPQGSSSMDNCLFGSCCLWLGAAVEGLLAPGLPCLSPHTGIDNELRFSFPIIDRVAGKCFLAFSPDSKVSLLTRRFSDTRHPCSLRGRAGCLLMVV